MGLSLTGGGGFFVFSGLADGFYTITPSKSEYVFTPSSRDITVAGANVTGQDFIAALDGTFNVSGTVLGPPYCSGCQLAHEGTTLNGATLTLTTSTPGDFSGVYSFNGVPNGTYTITPSPFSYSPSSRTVIVFGADVTGQDFLLLL